MKKAIVSPLCSAFVIPGLGQILNQQIKKGVLLLGAVFALFIAIIVQLYKLVNSLLEHAELGSLTPSDIVAHMGQMDSCLLAGLMFLSLALWAYSVIDALYYGLKADKEGEGSNEGLHP